jgi:hypothetical protein
VEGLLDNLLAGASQVGKVMVRRDGARRTRIDSTFVANNNSRTATALYVWYVWYVLHRMYVCVHGVGNSA